MNRPADEARTSRPRRDRVEREAPEIGAMLLRVIEAMVRRTSSGDLIALEELAALETFLDGAIRRAGLAAHDGPAAYSWTDIGLTLGITRQAARQRFTGER